MIKVVFKIDRKNAYGEQEFTYADYNNADIGDIVVVNTRYGFAIAKVTAVGIYDERFDENNLATIVTTICTAEQIREEEARKKFYETFKKRIKRNNLLKKISSIGLDSTDYELVQKMSDAELVDFYKSINNIDNF